MYVNLLCYAWPNTAWNLVFINRKNPAHFREYSHDLTANSGSEEDSEEDSGSSKPVCQYGAKCYRQNPAHLRECYHPPKGKAAVTSRTRPKRSEASKSEMPELAFIILVTYLSNLYNFSSIYFSSHKILPLYFFFFFTLRKEEFS